MWTALPGSRSSDEAAHAADAERRARRDGEKEREGCGHRIRRRPSSRIMATPFGVRGADRSSGRLSSCHIKEAMFKVERRLIRVRTQDFEQINKY